MKHTIRGPRRTFLPLLLGLVSLGAVATASAQTTIRGRILYGTVLDDIGEATNPSGGAPPGGGASCLGSYPADECGFLHAGDPIPHVWVQLNDGWGLRRDHAITDADGEFTMSVTGSPNLTLVVKAKNDYVTVKQYNGVIDNWLTDDAVKTETALSIDYSLATNDLGDITVTSDWTDFWRLNDDAANPKNYASRALYVTTAAHASGTHFEDLIGDTIPGGKVVVRMGLPGTAFYYTVSNTIFLRNFDASTFWHEYGHFMQDKFGAFDLIPAYAADGGHSACTEMTGSTLQDVCNALLPLPGWSPCSLLPDSETPSLPWAWIEGFAEFVAAANSNHYYGGSQEGNNALDDDHEIETSTCTLTNVASWTDPRAVESVVSEVLWDLVDDVQDPDNGSGIDEVADYDVADVLEVFDANVLGLDEFWDEWRRIHPGIVPDLYAAYAFNGADVGNAADLGSPEPVTLTSGTHVEHQWTNNPAVQLTVTDGIDATPEDHDDVSGSYSYFVVNDASSTTSVVTAGTPTFKSKETFYLHAVNLADGIGQYIHVNSLDMAGNPGTATTHFGPIHMDTVDPYWVSLPEVIPYRIDPIVPASDKTLVLGYPAVLKWSSHDDLSGVAEVRATFEDLQSPFTLDIVATPDEAGDFSWFVDGVPVTDSALIRFTVTDYAGNDTEQLVAVAVVPHFAGPRTMAVGSDSAPCDDGRVVSGDLNRDGYDDVVLVCRVNMAGQVFVFLGSSNWLTLSQTFAWLPADDLTVADVDRDGDLDVATVSQSVPPGGATQLDIFINDGTANLLMPPITRPLATMAQKTVRVLTPYGRRTPVLVVWGVLAAAGNLPVIRAFDVAAGLVPMATPGLDPVDGDWEVGDVDADGYQDLVALGVDAAGTAALSVFWGQAAGWSRQDIETYGSATETDVDLGDFDSDGRLDVSVMLDESGGLRITRLLRNGSAAGGFSTFAEATSVIRQIAEGDGHIVDTANDAASEVVSMGRNAAGAVAGWYLRNDEVVGTLRTAAAPGMTPLGETDTAWGDFDADGDLDVFQVGHNDVDFFVLTYENLLGDYIDTNDAPAPPGSLAAVYDAVQGGYVFSWTPPSSATTDETPIGGLGYELRIGTTSSGVQVLSWAHPAGASQQGASLQRFVRLPAGVYYYDVRSVDSGWRRSRPAGVKATTP